MMSNSIINALSRIIAGHDIQISGVIKVNRWISLTYQLSEKNLGSKNEVLIRLATQEDIDLLVRLEENKADTGYHIVGQMIRFWNGFGLRCMYVAYLKDDPSPFCWQYFIDLSEIERIQNTKYGLMYQSLAPDAAHIEGGYILYNLRRKDLFTKFVRARDKILYQKGIRLLRCHIACNESKTPMLKFCAKDRWIPDHWISMVTIRLPFFKSEVFVHHRIKDRDFSNFPLPLFYQNSR